MLDDEAAPAQLAEARAADAGEVSSPDGRRDCFRDYARLALRRPDKYTAVGTLETAALQARVDEVGIGRPKILSREQVKRAPRSRLSAPRSAAAEGLA